MIFTRAWAESTLARAQASSDAGSGGNGGSSGGHSTGRRAGGRARSAGTLHPGSAGAEDLLVGATRRPTSSTPLRPSLHEFLSATLGDDLPCVVDTEDMMIAALANLGSAHSSTAVVESKEEEEGWGEAHPTGASTTFRPATPATHRSVAKGSVASLASTFTEGSIVEARSARGGRMETHRRNKRTEVTPIKLPVWRASVGADNDGGDGASTARRPPRNSTGSVPTTGVRALQTLRMTQ